MSDIRLRFEFRKTTDDSINLSFWKKIIAVSFVAEREREREGEREGEREREREILSGSLIAIWS